MRVGGQIIIKNKAEIKKTLEPNGCCKVTGLYFNPEMFTHCGESDLIFAHTIRSCWSLVGNKWSWSEEWLILDDLTQEESEAYIYSLLIKKMGII